MDNKWFAKNIFFALLPGFIFHLYFLSKQDEMKEYYRKLEQMEREKILGLSAEAGGNVANSSSTNNLESQGGGGSGMGISAALITEGGSAWDKLKMTVSDIFLGGAEERISKQREIQSQQNGEETTSNQPVVNHNARSSGSSGNATTINASVLEQHSDPAIQVLLERIQALENQLGIGDDGANLTEEEQEEQRQKEHELKYRIQRMRQSPIRNRRDDMLREKWSKEKSDSDIIEEQTSDSVEEIDRDGAKLSYSFSDVATFAKLMLEPTFESTKEQNLERTLTRK